MRKVRYSEEYRELIEGSEVNKAAADAAYKQFATENIRHFRVRVKFGTLNLTASDIKSIKVSSDLFSGDSFIIGSTVIETLDLVIFKGADEIDKNLPIIPYISLQTIVDLEFIENGISVVRPTEVWQEVCLGIFYVVPDGINEEGVSITSIRASSLFSNPKYGNRTFETYDPDVPFNRSLTDIIDNICSDDIIPNFTLLNTDLPDMAITDADNIVGKTYAEIINYIATLYGGHARIIYEEETDKRYLEFFRFEKTDYFYDKSNYMSYKRGDEFLNIWKIECKSHRENEDGEEEEYYIVSGSGDANHTVSIECDDMTQERLDAILDYYEDYDTFHPITSKIFGSPILEVGDIITIRGRGTRHVGEPMPLHSITYNITGNGVTMDIRSLFKASSNMTVRKYIEEVSKKVDNVKEECSCDLSSIEDKITTLGEELGDDIAALEKEIDSHISNHPSGSIVDPPIDFYDGSTLIGSIDSVNVGNKETKSIIIDYSTNGGIAFGRFGSGVLNFAISDGDFGYNGTAYCDGVNMTDPVILDTMRFKTWLTMDENSDGEPIGYGELYADTYKGFHIFGQNDLYLGIQPGGERQNLLVLTQATNSETGTKKSIVTSYGDLWMTEHDIYLGGGDLYGDTSGNLASKSYAYYLTLDSTCDISAANSSTSVASQSTYTASLASSGTNENMIYKNMSYDEGELRWCWKETVFTYPESDVDPETDEWVYTGRNICYIELPIFMAENIEENYHINICKKSWGDYRIIEQNPYYFILESQEEDFAFTFEIVAKLKDNAIGSSTEEPIIIEEEEN